MKSIKLLTLAMLTGLTAGAVFAADPPTRAEVKKEGVEARKAGETGAAPEAGPATKPAKSTKTRAEGRAERAKDIKDGKRAKAPEAGAPESPSKSTRARSEVKAEQAAAAKAGQRPPQGN